MQRYVAGFLFSENGSSVALVLKRRPSWQAGKLNGIGGKVEEGESVPSAMEREFREEAGVDFYGWVPFVRLWRADTWEVFFYVGRSQVIEAVRTMTDEPIVVVDTDLVCLRNDIVPNLKWLIPMALNEHVAKGTFIDVEDVGGY
jgi:8-oxo-dGTP diphosphatase